MKKTVFLLVAALIFPLVSFADHPGAPLPGAGLTPASAFYFLERISESIEELFAFGAEAKARLRTKFAAERIAEIQAMLESEKVNPRGLRVARARLESHLAGAEAAVASVKGRDKDASLLAKEIVDAINVQREAAKGIFGKALGDEKELLLEKLKAGKDALLGHLSEEDRAAEEKKGRGRNHQGS